MLIIIGLGNPGQKYEKTRHNAGFMALDYLAQKMNLSWRLNKKLQSQIASGQGIILAKPETYMNNSGQAVQAILNFYKMPKGEIAENLIIIHDEIDLPLGKYRLSKDSRSAGNNGVESIINYLKTKNFARLRIGIKTEENKNIPTDKFVMQKFYKEEQNLINKIIESMTKAEILAKYSALNLD